MGKEIIKKKVVIATLIWEERGFYATVAIADRSRMEERYAESEIDGNQERYEMVPKKPWKG